MTKNILIATIKSWNIDNAIKLKSLLSKQGVNLFLVTDNSQLTLEYIKNINPRYIFSPHWSWIIRITYNAVLTAARPFMEKLFQQYMLVRYYHLQSGITLSYLGQMFTLILRKQLI